jgi:hypothetical protein
MFYYVLTIDNINFSYASEKICLSSDLIDNKFSKVLLIYIYTFKEIISFDGKYVFNINNGELFSRSS